MMKNPFAKFEREAHKKCSNHRIEMLAAKQCGCFYCIKLFPVSEIKDWTDEQQTALCPHCQVDALIPDDGSLTIKKLTQLNDFWFKIER